MAEVVRLVEVLAIGDGSLNSFDVFLFIPMKVVISIWAQFVWRYDSNIRSSRCLLQNLDRTDAKRAVTRS